MARLRNIALCLFLAARVLCAQEPEVRAIDMNEYVRYIVHVTPSSSQGTSVLNKTARTEASARRTAVRRQIDAMASSVQTLREFTSVLNAVCVRTQRKNLSALQHLPGVSGVTEDIRVSSYPLSLASSSAQPSAPLHGIATGKGIKVGIIDSGIDYMHEALGGGFGASFKVRGGYDFVNNDADPMDDDGHGTHVAGIIAGESPTISGMAVNAVLYSYKVLDKTGSGSGSDVIAAIEQAIQDGMNVINLSLGAPHGDPDDDISQAVDNAAAMGIVVVAAAGNDGTIGSIGTPGSARQALTVGAVDNNDVPAAFSSQGPTQKNYGLKPNVMAPGVSIRSAKLGGGYLEMSGTSMSVPYVSGLAAALAELHPAWTGSQIRDRIIESARSLQKYSLFTAGSGLVDPLKALTMQTIAQPSSMSLGFNSSKTSAWEKRETLYVANASAAPQSYALTAVTSSPNIAVQCQPASITVEPLGKGMVIVSIQASGVLAANKALSDGYTGTIVARSAADTVRVPFAFFKGTVLQLHFSEKPQKVVVHDGAGIVYAETPPSTDLCLVVPSGTYDVVTKFYSPHYVVREGIAASGLVQDSVRKDDAKHPLRLLPIDESGRAVAAGLPHEVFNSIAGIVHCSSQIDLFTTDYGDYTQVQAQGVQYISDVSSRYVFGYFLNILQGNSTTYSYEAAVTSGITDSVTIQFAGSEGKAIDVRYDVDSSKTPAIFPILYSYIKPKSGLIRTRHYDPDAAPLRFPFTQRSVYFKRSSPFFPVFQQRVAYKY